MSDRPAKKTKPTDEQASGWHTPSASGEWHSPQPKTDTGGWRVPVLPTNMEAVPKEKGKWHLPRPEDTIYTANDTTEIATPPEDLDTGETTSSPEDVIAAAKAAPIAPEDALFATESPAPDSTKTADGPPEDLLHMALQAQNNAPAVPEEDEDAFSMSEWVALASLEEEAQRKTAASSTMLNQGTQATEVLPTAPDTDAAAGDAAEYARRQLAQLDADDGAPAAGTGAPASAVPTGVAPADAALDPAEYARRQLQQLDSGEGDFTPVPESTAPLDPVQAELARKFRDTEQQIRTLRASFQAGQITRDDLQAQLRQLMILDDKQVWWMMGVESDTWYKFENNQWVPAAPPVALPPRTGAPPTATSQLDPNQVIQGSLPYLPNQEAAPVGGTQYETGYSGEYPSGASSIPLDENYMPLPQSVPVNDPNYTVVNPRVSYGATRPNDAVTLQGNPAVSGATVVSQPVSEPTVMAQPVQYGAVQGQPYTDEAAAEPPSYDLGKKSPIYEDISRKRRQSTVRTLAVIAVVLVGLMFLALAGLVFAAQAWYSGIISKWEPQIVALQNYTPAFQTAKILDANGDLIAELNSQEGGARTKVDLKDISPFMIHAVISSENERFYEDPGWDIIAITRAFIQNLAAGDIQSGASTITQQIARNFVLQNTETTAQRKVEEIVVAGELAKRYDKNFILNLYLNEVFFGNQSYGVEAAAEFYFGKHAIDLNLPEAAMLTGIIQNPSAYDPVLNRKATFDRMDTVIGLMAKLGCIQPPDPSPPLCVNKSDVYQPNSNTNYTPKLAFDVAQIESRQYLPRVSNVKYPHFVTFVQSQLDSLFGPGEMFKRGFIVKTTLVPQIQDAAQDALTQQVARVGNTGVDTGAVMVTSPRTGAILAMVGSSDFNNTNIAGQVNNTLTWQQPGSSIKPVVYAAAFKGVDKNNNGVIDPGEYFTPATILWDVPTVFPGNYAPKNFDNRFHGPVAVRFALGNSYNIPAIKTYDFIGTDAFKKTALDMGLEFLPDCTTPDESNCARFGLPSGIGATDVRLYDMMKAYGTLANAGTRISLYAIDSVTDSSGQKVDLPARPDNLQAVSPQVAYLLDSILSDDNARADAFGRNGPLTLPGYPLQDAVAAKTGTTNDARDMWTLGYTKNIAVGVWIGRHDNQPTIGGGGAQVVAPVWNQVMKVALGNQPIQKFDAPTDIVQQTICSDTGTLPSDSCANRRGELFLINQPPPPADQAFVQTIAIDTWSGLRANQNCPDNQLTKVFASLTDTAAVDWLNKTAEGQAYAKLIGLPQPFEVAPASECPFGMNIPTVRILDPFDNKTLTGNVSVTGQVSAGTDFNRYQLEYASAQAPNNFQIIGNFSTTQQPNAGAVLGTWDTTTVPNGTYVLRLTVIANNGGFVYKTVTVNVNNVQPTPLPTALPTSPPFVGTPLPFDTIVPQTAPTPTVSVPLG